MALNTKTALITGASSGIGSAFATAIAQKGEHNLILVARRESRLEELKSTIETQWHTRDNGNSEVANWVKIFICDLANPTQRSKLLQDISSSCPPIDLLINNAGFGSYGYFANQNLTHELQMIELNCSATLHLSHHFLKQMSSRKSGTIINIASVNSFQPMPFMATYAATKAFIHSLSCSLAIEAAKYGVLVQVVCPGPTESEFHLVAGVTEAKINMLPTMTAQAVVSQSLESVSGKKTIVIPGWTNRLLAHLARILPTQLTTRIIASQLGKFAK